MVLHHLMVELLDDFLCINTVSIPAPKALHINNLLKSGKVRNDVVVIACLRVIRLEELLHSIK